MTDQIKQEREQRIRDLQARLDSTASDIGDWKIAKCMECQMLGLEMPYEISTLHAARQVVRDEINAIMEELAAAEQEAES